MTRRFDAFIRQLSSAEVSDRACNQFSRTAGDLRGNTIRRDNLRLYLGEMERIQPAMLLVGEAVSYRGGRLTGIAFVSETVMLAGVETNNGRVLGADQGYRKATDGPKLSTEASATMVWGTIRSIRPLPMLWNAFPFHPFHPGNPLSNRVPTSSELALGGELLARLLRLFDFRTIVAIGNQSSLCLTRLGVGHAKVRHPSMGGKNLFLEGMAQLSQTMQP